jgi:hypothetical protein
MHHVICFVYFFLYGESKPTTYFLVVSFYRPISIATFFENKAPLRTPIARSQEAASIPHLFGERRCDCGVITAARRSNSALKSVPCTQSHKNRLLLGGALCHRHFRTGAARSRTCNALDSSPGFPLGPSPGCRDMLHVLPRRAWSVEC